MQVVTVTLLTVAASLASDPCTFVYTDTETSNFNLFYLLETLSSTLESSGTSCPSRTIYLQNKDDSIAFTLGSRASIKALDYSLVVATYCPEPACNYEEIEIVNDPTRVLSLETAVTLRFERVILTGKRELLPLGHCIGEDYSVEAVEVDVDTVKKLMCVDTQIYPVFSLSHKDARIEFHDCEISDLRYRPFSFILFFTNGSVLLSHTSIHKIDLASNSAFITQYIADITYVTVAIIDCKVTMFNPDHRYYRSKSPTAGFMKLRRVTRLEVSNTRFENNVIFAGDNYQASSAFIDLGLIDQLEVTNVTYNRNMGGVKMVLKGGETSLCRIQNSQFTNSYNAGGALSLGIESVGAVSVSLYNVTFSGNAGERGDPLLSVRLSLSSQGRSALTMASVTCDSNMIGGVAAKTALIEVQSADVTVSSCNFTNNRGFTLRTFPTDLVPITPIFIYLRDVLHMPIDPQTMQEKTGTEGNCSYALLLRDAGKFDISDTGFIGRDVGYSCETQLAVVNFCSDCGPAEGAVNGGIVVSGGGTGVSITDDSQSTVFHLSLSFLTFYDNSVSAIHITSSPLSTVSLLSCQFAINGFRSSTDSSVYITAASANITNSTFRYSSGYNGGAVAFITTCSAEKVCNFTVNNCTFSGNYAKRFAGDIYLSATESGKFLQFRILQSTFVNSSAEEAGSVLHISSISSSGSTITNCNIATAVSSSGGVINFSYFSGDVTVTHLQVVNIRSNSLPVVVVETVNFATVRLRDCDFSNIVGSCVVSVQAKNAISNTETEGCRFIMNNATAICAYSGLFTDRNSIISQHTSDFGSALKQYTGTVTTFVGTRFIDNFATYSAAVGAVEGPNSEFSVSEIVAKGNKCSKFGGAFTVKGGVKLTVFRSLFEGNEADRGSVLSITKNSVHGQVANCTFTANRGNAVIDLNFADVEILLTTFSANSDKGSTSGVSVVSSYLTMRSVSVIDTSGDSGCVVSAQANSFLSLLNVSISNVTCKEALVISQASTVTLWRLLVEKSAVSRAEGVALQDSNATVTDSIFSKLSVVGAVVSCIRSRVKFDSSVVEVSNASAIRSSASDNLTVIRSNFTELKGGSCGAVCTTSVGNITISDCLFTNCTGSDSGCLGVTSSLGSTAIITRSTFTSCAGTTTGGISLQDANATISYSAFRRCRGNTGGGVAFIGSSLSTVYNSSFESNSASIGGGLYWSKFPPTLHYLSYSNNSASVYGPNTAGPAISLQFLTAPMSLTTIPGHKVTDTISVGLCDESGQVVASDNDSEGELKAVGGVLAGEFRVKANSGVLQFANYSVAGEPGARCPLSVASSTLTLAAQEFSVSLGSCAEGEVLTGAKTCVKCAAGSFVLGSESACKPCPTGGKCSGGTDLTPGNGYWRLGERSQRLWMCPNPGSCLSSNTCASGYTSHLCQSCVSGFSRSGQDWCFRCPSPAANAALLTVFSVIAAVGIGVIVCKVVLRSGAVLPVETRAVITHIQVMALLSSFRFSWPAPIVDLFSSDYLRSSTKSVSLECVLTELWPQGTSPTFQRLLFLAVIPLPLAVAAALLASVNKVLATTDIVSDWTATFSFLLYILSPTVLHTALPLFQCMEIEDSGLWLRADLAVHCWTSPHSKYAYTAALPMAIVWGLFFPLAITLWVRRAAATETRTAFFVSGLHARRQWWELLVSIYKLAISAIYAFLSTSAETTQATSVLSLSILLVGAFLLISPFSCNRNFPLFSLSTILITAIAGEYCLAESDSSVLQVLSIAVVIGLNAGCVGWFLYAFFTVWRQQTRVLIVPNAEEIEVSPAFPQSLKSLAANQLQVTTRRREAFRCPENSLQEDTTVADID